MEQLFQKLGFTALEARAYLALADVGKAPASVLAKNLEVPRSTAYSILQSLVTKGVVSCEKDKDPALYMPLAPQTLRQLVESEKEKTETALEEKLTTAIQLEGLIQPFFQQKNYSIPKIQFFEGIKSVESMLYTHAAAWQESISHYDNTWWGYQDTHFVEHYRKWLDYYWATRGPDEEILLLSNRAEVEKKLKGKVSKRTIKPLPKGYEFSSTIWVLGDYVILIMTRQQPHYAFQLKDAVFASNQRMLFQMLWKLIG